MLNLLKSPLCLSWLQFIEKASMILHFLFSWHSFLRFDWYMLYASTRHTREVFWLQSTRSPSFLIYIICTWWSSIRGLHLVNWAPMSLLSLMHLTGLSWFNFPGAAEHNEVLLMYNWIYWSDFYGTERWWVRDVVSLFWSVEKVVLGRPRQQSW